MYVFMWVRTFNITRFRMIDGSVEPEYGQYENFPPLLSIITGGFIVLEYFFYQYQ